MQSPSTPSPTQKKEPPALMDWRTGGWIGVVGVVPLFLCKILLIWKHPLLLGWIEFALATPVLGLTGARFYQSAFGQLRRWKTNSDTWITGIVFLLYAYSLWVLTLWGGGYLFLSEAALFITLLSFRRARGD